MEEGRGGRGERWRRGEVEEERGGEEGEMERRERWRRKWLASHLRIQVIQGELLCGESQVALLRKTQCKLTVSVKFRRGFLPYLVHPHGERVPVCDQEPLSDVKLSLIDQQGSLWGEGGRERGRRGEERLKRRHLKLVWRRGWTHQCISGRPTCSPSSARCWRPAPKYLPVYPYT